MDEDHDHQNGDAENDLEQVERGRHHFDRQTSQRVWRDHVVLVSALDGQANDGSKISAQWRREVRKCQAS